jgi:hypothetical protein
MLFLLIHPFILSFILSFFFYVNLKGLYYWLVSPLCRDFSQGTSVNEFEMSNEHVIMLNVFFLWHSVNVANSLQYRHVMMVSFIFTEGQASRCWVCCRVTRIRRLAGRIPVVAIALTFKNRASYRYPPDVAFYIYFFNKYKYWVFKHAAHSVFLFKMSFIS